MLGDQMGRKSGRPGTGADAGSAFVESIIAAAIVAMALGATLRVIADGAGRDRAVASHRAALLIAQSELAAAGSEFPLAPGQTSGLAGDMAWRVEVSPYADGIDDSAAGPLWKVAVTVRPRAGGAAIVRLESLRLGARAP